MLAFNTKRLFPKTVNTMVLEVAGGYAYVSKDIYDQALRLSATMSPESLKTLLDCGDSNKEAIEFATENLPEPLNILSAYLGTVKEPVENDVSVILGCIHVISQSIDLGEFAKKPKDIRKLLEFSKSIFSEYQESWKAFWLVCVEEDIVTRGIPQVLTTADLAQLMMGAPRSYSPVKDGKEEVYIEGVTQNNDGSISLDEDALGQLQSLFDDFDFNAGFEEEMPKIDLKAAAERQAEVDEKVEEEIKEEESTADKLLRMIKGGD